VAGASWPVPGRDAHGGELLLFRVCFPSLGCRSVWTRSLMSSLMLSWPMRMAVPRSFRAARQAKAVASAGLSFRVVQGEEGANG
jgi:hypothetical protein